MPKSAVVVLVIGIIGLVVASLFIFHITDSFTAKQPEATKTVNITKDTKVLKQTTPTIMNGTTDTNGLKIEDTKIGTGREVKSGDTVVINYLGTLTDGTKFDSSYDRGQPFETQIGIGQVIKGWDLGVVGMKVGGKRKLTIPPELGYGSQDMGSIPPNSTLIFEVELIDVK
jgi:FKBP-type peptidyl-prolyl cis-trans isomerase